MKTILIIILTCFSTLIYGQNEIYLTVKHKYKRVDIKYGYIGLTTSNDTIDYHEQKELSSKIYRVTKDSLYLIRPKVYHCELVDSVEKLSIRRRDSYIYLRTIRELRKKLLA